MVCKGMVSLTAGQAEQWSDAVQDVLATAHLQLDILYLGLEDPAAAKTFRHVATFPLETQQGILRL